MTFDACQFVGRWMQKRRQTANQLELICPKRATAPVVMTMGISRGWSSPAVRFRGSISTIGGRYSMLWRCHWGIPGTAAGSALGHLWPPMDQICIAPSECVKSPHRKAAYLDFGSDLISFPYENFQPALPGRSCEGQPQPMSLSAIPSMLGLQP